MQPRPGYSSRSSSNSSSSSNSNNNNMPLTIINHGRLSGRVTGLGVWLEGGSHRHRTRRLSTDCPALQCCFIFSFKVCLLHANAWHWGSSHARAHAQPRPAAKLTSKPSALWHDTCKGARDTATAVPLPGRGRGRQAEGGRRQAATAAVTAGCRQVMYAIIRRGPFATPVLLPTANWQLGNGRPCHVTGSSSSNGLWWPGQSSMQKPNSNCQDVTTLPCVRVCRTCLIAQFMRGCMS